jgi:hypothetical protein
MAANNPTISDGESARAEWCAAGAIGAQACQPRIHAAIPLEASSAPPSPARPAPSHKATRRSCS